MADRPTHGCRRSRDPVTVSLACNHQLNPSVGAEENVQLPSEFQRALKEIIDRSESFDNIVINLKIYSADDILHGRYSEGGEEPQQDEPEGVLNQMPVVDCGRLERILSSIYTLVEREKAAKEELMMLQVDVLIAGFSRVRRSQTPDQLSQTFRTLALGGTFDHLHSGHKILLTIACWLTTHKLIVGITGDELLKNKKYVDKLEGVNERKEGVRKFIERVGPGDIKLEMPILQDIYGPTATEPEIDGLLVTRETSSGADSIDEIRATNQLKPLKRYVIDVISPTDSHLDGSNLKDLKISSTQIRRWLHELDPTSRVN